MEATGRRGRKSKQLFDDLKEKRVSWKLKEEALDHTVCWTRFGRGYAPVVRLTAEWLSRCPRQELNMELSDFKSEALQFERVTKREVNI